MKSAIVAGADGFLGKALVKKLIKKDIKVYALMRHIDKAEANENVSNIKFDLNDLQSLQNVLPNNVDVYFNMAWSGVSSSVKNDYYMQMENIKFYLATMELVNKINCQRVVFPGSTSEYAYTEMPITANSLPAPSDAYSSCKIAARYICQIYAAENGQSFIWAPISSIYGPGRNDNNLITYAIKTLQAHKIPKFTKLEQIWDYIYISDVVDAFFLLGDKESLKSGIYPIGSGQHRQLKDYVEIIKNIINKDAILEIGALPYKTNRIDNCIVDITKLSTSTGFNASVDFEDGIRRTIKYFDEIGEHNYV